MRNLIRIILLTISISIPWQISVAADSNARIEADEATEQWVQKNIDDIHKMTRKDWLNVSETMSIPIYLAFTPQQKQAFWLDKAKEVMALDGWGTSEKEHLQKLITFLHNHPDAFKTPIKESDNKSEISLFFEDWTEYATSTLGWSKGTIAAIIGKGNVMINKAGELKPLKSYNMKNIPLGN